MILDAVQTLNSHATAEQVYEAVAKEYPAIGKATVYKNLSQMAKAGELLNIGAHGGSTRYDHNLHRHHHFICEDCERVFDVNLPGIDGQFGELEGFCVKNLTLSGLCPECKEAGICNP